jgi:LacI family transcriptional regulator
MVTIKDIAKEAGVSTATVSYVINESGNIGKETRERVLKVIEKLNYRPNSIAKSLKINRTNTIGVIVEDITIFNAPSIIDGINEFAESRGFSTILTNLRLFKRFGHDFANFDKLKEMITRVADELISKQVEGIIYVGMHTRDMTGLLDHLRVPLIYTYCYTTLESDRSVNYDDELAAFEATRYLIHNGHSKIGVISGLIASVPSHGRLTGYQRALMETRLMFNPAYIKIGDWEFESGYRLAKELLQIPDPPTAILGMNDLMAGGAIEACIEMGIKVPRDISIIGFDNREFSGFYTPKLTTMQLPLREMGAAAIDTMIGLIEKPDEIKPNEKLKCTLVERESVAHPKL